MCRASERLGWVGRRASLLKRLRHLALCEARCREDETVARLSEVPSPATKALTPRSGVTYQEFPLCAAQGRGMKGIFGTSSQDH